MTIEERKKILETHPVFIGTDEKLLYRIAEQVHEKIFPPKSMVLFQDEEANVIYFIYEGLVKIYLMNVFGEQVPIGTPGDRYVVGELGVLDDGNIPSSVETIQETHVLSLTKGEFINIVMVSPQVAGNVLKLLVKKIRRANEYRENTFTLHLKERTMNVLKTLSGHFPNKEIELSQEELALLVGATRPRVTEMLQQLEKENKIHLAKRKIKLL